VPVQIAIIGPAVVVLRCYFARDVKEVTDIVVGALYVLI
jgi:hypothetical protein